jgi:hypothetical protein
MVGSGHHSKDMAANVADQETLSPYLRFSLPLDLLRCPSWQWLSFEEISVAEDAPERDIELGVSEVVPERLRMGGEHALTGDDVVGELAEGEA